MVKDKKGSHTRTPDNLTDLLEHPSALERVRNSGELPSAADVASFVMEKHGHPGAVRIMSDLLWVTMKAGNVNAGSFYFCVLLELHGEPLGRFARTEMARTMEAFWRPKQ